MARDPWEKYGNMLRSVDELSSFINYHWTDFWKVKILKELISKEMEQKWKPPPA
jgi:hypothetical protein